jgi:hypothetical protein
MKSCLLTLKNCLIAAGVASKGKLAKNHLKESFKGPKAGSGSNRGTGMLISEKEKEED